MHEAKFITRSLGFAIAMMVSQSAAAAFALVPGNVYTADSSTNTILQVDSTGVELGSLTVPGALDGVRGMAFGADGTMYVVVPAPGGFKVLLLNAKGNVRGEYTGTSYIGGNLSYGKIAVSGNRFYVAGANNLVAFDRNVAAGAIIYQTNQAYDVDVLPSGNLLLASAYQIDELNTAGQLVRQVPISTSILTDVRGVQYNTATNKIYATMLGHTNFFFRLMRFDATSGALEQNITFNYADDITYLANGNLLVGSRTQSPTIFTPDLTFVSTLNAVQRMFVATMPEPTIMFQDGMEGF